MFTVHALCADSLDVDADTRPGMLGFFMFDKTLGRASITPTYSTRIWRADVRTEPS